MNVYYYKTVYVTFITLHTLKFVLLFLEMLGVNSKIEPFYRWIYNLLR
jgi:hypothetical protein